MGGVDGTLFFSRNPVAVYSTLLIAVVDDVIDGGGGGSGDNERMHHINIYIIKMRSDNGGKREGRKERGGR
jgi:hypothetical protein